MLTLNSDRCLQIHCPDVDVLVWQAPADAQGFVDSLLVDSKASSSCPAVLDESSDGTPRRKGGRQRESTPPSFKNDDEKTNWQKERVKKDNHNQSE